MHLPIDTSIFDEPNETPGNDGPIVMHGLSNAAYHAHPSISKSGLDLIHAAPALYQYRREHPIEPSQALKMGTLVHTAVLEPDELRMISRPECDRRSSEGKRIYAEFVQQLAATGATEVTEDERQRVIGCREALFAHPGCRKALDLVTDVEVSIFWEVDGVACRCRPDAITSNGLIVDVKTTRDASRRGFAKSVANYRYHVQGAFYSDGYEAAFGEPPKGFIFLAVETEPPHLCAVHYLPPQAIMRGRAAYQQDLATYRRCLETGVWPGLEDEPIVIDLPPWAD